MQRVEQLESLLTISTMERLIKSISQLPLTDIFWLKNAYFMSIYSRDVKREKSMLMKMRHIQLKIELSVISVNVDIFIKIISSQALIIRHASLCCEREKWRKFSLKIIIYNHGMSLKNVFRQRHCMFKKKNINSINASKRPSIILTCMCAYFREACET